MTIPALNSLGLLPAGIYASTLEEIPPIFCFNDHRWLLWDDGIQALDLLCNIVLKDTACMPTLVLGGSFFSDKSAPNDIEATLKFPADTSVQTSMFWLRTFARLHATLKEDHRLDFYPSLPGINDFSLFFQYAGPKTAESKNIGEKDLRGILSVGIW